MSIEEIFEAAKQICTPPIPDDAVERLDQLKAQLPVEYHGDFNWYYEGLFYARASAK